MRFDKRFDAVRSRRHHHGCGVCAELEAELDRIQAEVAELLARVPDPVPASITIHAQ